jgi:hypothetical protein
MTGKAWSKDLASTTQRISSLISQAAKHVPLGGEWESWCRNKDSFVGHELRKSINLRGSHVIFEEEAQYLESLFAIPLAAYNKALEDIKSPTVAMLSSLEERFKKVGSNLRAMSELVDKITSHRMSILYPKEKGKKGKKGPQVPIGTRIANLELEEFIFAFDPSMWGNWSPFRCVLDPKSNNSLDMEASRKDYENRIRAIKSKGQEELVTLCTKFAADKLKLLIS